MEIDLLLSPLGAKTPETISPNDAKITNPTSFLVQFMAVTPKHVHEFSLVARLVNLIRTYKEIISMF